MTIQILKREIADIADALTNQKDSPTPVPPKMRAVDQFELVSSWNQATAPEVPKNKLKYSQRCIVDKARLFKSVSTEQVNPYGIIGEHIPVDPADNSLMLPIVGEIYDVSSVETNQQGEILLVNIQELDNDGIEEHLGLTPVRDQNDREMTLDVYNLKGLVGRTYMLPDTVQNLRLGNNVNSAIPVTNPQLMFYSAMTGTPVHLVESIQEFKGVGRTAQSGFDKIVAVTDPRSGKEHLVASEGKFKNIIVNITDKLGGVRQQRLSDFAQSSGGMIAGARYQDETVCIPGSECVVKAKVEVYRQNAFEFFNGVIAAKPLHSVTIDGLKSNPFDQKTASAVTWRLTPVKAIRAREFLEIYKEEQDPAFLIEVADGLEISKEQYADPTKLGLEILKKYIFEYAKQTSKLIDSGYRFINDCLFRVESRGGWGCMNRGATQHLVISKTKDGMLTSEYRKRFAEMFVLDNSDISAALADLEELKSDGDPVFNFKWALFQIQQLLKAFHRSGLLSDADLSSPVFFDTFIAGAFGAKAGSLGAGGAVDLSSDSLFQFTETSIPLGEEVIPDDMADTVAVQMELRLYDHKHDLDRIFNELEANREKTTQSFVYSLLNNVRGKQFGYLTERKYGFEPFASFVNDAFYYAFCEGYKRNTNRPGYIKSKLDDLDKYIHEHFSELKAKLKAKLKQTGKSSQVKDARAFLEIFSGIHRALDAGSDRVMLDLSFLTRSAVKQLNAEAGKSIVADGKITSDLGQVVKVYNRLLQTLHS